MQWHRVVADGAQILANQRSARAVALLGLVGGARWCVVERENMAAVESSSERMRVSYKKYASAACLVCVQRDDILFAVAP